MTFTFRPAVRENTPLIVGIAGPTKSGKSFSALRLAIGLADGGTIAMLNAEGKRGEQYADNFKYVNCNIEPPYSPERYTEALLAMAEIKPAVGIVDSASHMHDGPGGLLEYHDAELKRLSGGDDNKRDRNNWTAWIKPKAAENKFIYTMLGMNCPIILCFRAKEKLKIITGKPPIDLGWQPIAGDRITFETIFTLVLPPHSKGVPDLEQSEMRQPFDKMVPAGKAIDEDLGRKLAAWARGSESAPVPCDKEDFMDISTAAADAGLDPKVITEQLRTMGFAKSRDLTKERKSELLTWITSQKKLLEAQKR